MTAACATAGCASMSGLDLRGIDVHAAADDHVSAAADDHVAARVVDVARSPTLKCPSRIDERVALSSA
jgi:hypothetical protein